MMKNKLMASGVDLGSHLEFFVARLVAEGRYGSKNEVLREGVRLIQEQEMRIAAIGHGLADAEAGRLKPAGEVFGCPEAKYASLAEAKTQ